jgi:hypothetical protein
MRMSFKLLFFLVYAAFSGRMISGKDGKSMWRSKNITDAVFCLLAGMNYSISGFPDKDVYKTSLSSLDAVNVFLQSLYAAHGISTVYRKSAN